MKNVARLLVLSFTLLSLSYCGVDSDGDGTPDFSDRCPLDPNKTNPGQCGCGIPEGSCNIEDSDGDGTPNDQDACPSDPNKINPGECGCGVAEGTCANQDSDGDGVFDPDDGCPTDPNKTQAGICGCGQDDKDADGDEMADCQDGCPTDPNKTQPGDCGCSVSDQDADDNGTADCLDPQLTIDDVVQQVDQDRLQDMVYYLASDQLRGRYPGTDGDRLAQEYIQQHFEKAGLTPGNPDNQSYLQPFTSGSRKTANVIGFLEGGDPNLVDEFIVVGGHFDHLGASGNTIYNGADDNASGSSAVMEVAYAMGKLQPLLKRSIIFMTFGAEEMGLIGSRYYCKNPLYRLRDTVIMVNFDMIGRKGRDLRNEDMSSLVDEMLLALYEGSQDPETDFIHARGGTDSDSFNNVGVRTKDYFTGLHSDYHKPSDTANKINYAGMKQIVKTAVQLIWRVAQEGRRVPALEQRTAPIRLEKLMDHGRLPFLPLPLD